MSQDEEVRAAVYEHVHRILDAHRAQNPEFVDRIATRIREDAALLHRIATDPLGCDTCGKATVFVDRGGFRRCADHAQGETP